MGFGALLIEYIFAGYQSLIWITILLILFIDTGSINDGLLEELDIETITKLVIILTPVVYPLGMVVDSIAQLILNKSHQKIRTQYINKESGTSLKLILFSDNEGLNDYLASIRSTARIARSTALNFFLTFFLIFLLILFRLGDELEGYYIPAIFFTIFTWIFLVSISLIAWKSNTIKYYKKLAIGVEYMRTKG